jgi:hypothetical protein
MEQILKILQEFKELYEVTRKSQNAIWTIERQSKYKVKATELENNLETVLDRQPNFKLLHKDKLDRPALRIEETKHILDKVNLSKKKQEEEEREEEREEAREEREKNKEKKKKKEKTIWPILIIIPA